MTTLSTTANAVYMMSSAIAALAGEECFHTFDSIRHCLPPASLLSSCVGIHVQPQTMTTWLPQNRVMCILKRADCGSATLIQIHDRVFFAAPVVALAAETPPGVIFYALYTEDTVRVDGAAKSDSEFVVRPRLLVYDMEDLNADGMHTMQASERYHRLRCTVGPRFLSRREGIVIVHWVGFFSAAHKVFTRDVGHKVEALVCLTDRPGELVPPLWVSVPEYTRGFNLKRDE